MTKRNSFSMLISKRMRNTKLQMHCDQGHGFAQFWAVVHAHCAINGNPRTGQHPAVQLRTATLSMIPAIKISVFICM